MNQSITIRSNDNQNITPSGTSSTTNGNTSQTPINDSQMVNQDKTNTSTPLQDQKISVFILQDHHHHSFIERCGKLFNDPLFDVTVLDDSPVKAEQKSVPTSSFPSFSPFTTKMTERDQREIKQVQTVLKQAREKYPSRYLIIVKDTTVSNASPETIASIVKSVIKSGTFDLAYLSKWSDRCSMYTDKKILDNGVTVVVKTQSPLGVQAILFSPNGRDRVSSGKFMKNGKIFRLEKPLGNQLNDEIFNGNLEAFCVVPNLMHFDITHATSYADYQKMTECEIPKTRQFDATGMSTSSNRSSAWWLLFFLVLIIIIMWLAFSDSKRLFGLSTLVRR